MAYIDKDDFFPIWWPEPLPDDFFSGVSVEVLGQLREAVAETLEEESFGFIFQGWFGPFLLGPSTRLLRGRC
ncbi:MAG: hypothetical protein FJ134_00210 [Deltaproteobacteria bacterium]|nr:hypothetical protein [Deltaproteobacteria bacterium]